MAVEAKSQWIEEMLQEMAVGQLIVYIRIKGGAVRRPTGNLWWCIREAGASKAEQSLGLDEK